MKVVLQATVRREARGHTGDILQRFLRKQFTRRNICGEITHLRGEIGGCGRWQMGGMISEWVGEGEEM